MRGFITLASTRPRYLEMAADLALSLRAFNREPVALILGDELRPLATPALLALFDHVVPLQAGYPRNIGKLYAPHASPFERTLFLDADCLALGDFADLWERLEPAAFALQGEVLTLEHDMVHGMRSTAERMRQFGLKRYVKSNSGIFYFRKAQGMAVADACLALYHEAFGPGMHCDETLMAIVSDRLDISVMPKPLPMPWWPSSVEVGDERYKLVHFIGRPKPATMRWLMDGVRRRRAAAGLPPEASIRHWWRKTSPWTWDKIRYRAITGAFERYMKFRRRLARATVSAR